MAQPFDVTLKDLLETHPADCLRLAGIVTDAPITVIDADLATVSAEADKVFRIEEPQPWLMHFEPQASYDAGLPERMLRYNVLLHGRHQLPVRSVALLLRPKADGPEMTGAVRHRLGDERYLKFAYRILRIWEMPVETVLAGGIGTLPLAPLADVTEAALPGVIRRMEARTRAETTPAEQATLWTSTYVLMGLRYQAKFVSRLLEGVRAMEESVTYQAIIRKGEAKGKVEGAVHLAQKMLLIQGEDRFGAPDASTKSALAAITDLDRLESLIPRILHVANWAELLAEPKPARRKPRKKT